MTPRFKNVVLIYVLGQTVCARRVGDDEQTENDLRTDLVTKEPDTVVNKQSLDNQLLGNLQRVAGLLESWTDLRSTADQGSSTTSEAAPGSTEAVSTEGVDQTSTEKDSPPKDDAKEPVESPATSAAGAESPGDVVGDSRGSSELAADRASVDKSMEVAIDELIKGNASAMLSVPDRPMLVLEPAGAGVPEVRALPLTDTSMNGKVMKGFKLGSTEAFSNAEDLRKKLRSWVVGANVTITEFPADSKLTENSTTAEDLINALLNRTLAVLGPAFANLTVENITIPAFANLTVENLTIEDLQSSEHEGSPGQSKNILQKKTHSGTHGVGVHTSLAGARWNEEMLAVWALCAGLGVTIASILLASIVGQPHPHELCHVGDSAVHIRPKTMRAASTQTQAQSDDGSGWIAEEPAEQVPSATQDTLPTHRSKPSGLLSEVASLISFVTSSSSVQASTRGR
eukprot:TRINITY_DN36985_c0_g1_i1.p1 TRINITY_DN36985_c0_g1~~TRINITY_DN36985_c0_g1_i1.p1  ORF type:complete len:456 (-),score=59.67 TRINITY_DN36985_c0_g1_i1:78-1445(-)